MALTRAEVLAAIGARETETIEVGIPEWNGSVYVRRMSAGEAEVSGLFDDPTRVMTRLVAMTTADEAGARLFTDRDVKALAGAEFAVITRIFTASASLNGLSDAALEDATAAFAAAQPDASSSS